MVYIVRGFLEDHDLGCTLLRGELWHLIAELEETGPEVLSSPPLQDIVVGSAITILRVWRFLTAVSAAAATTPSTAVPVVGSLW